MIKFHWKHVAIALAILPFAALIFAWIGFFNVGASSGHWKITDWFLHFAMRSAVRTYALAVETPETLPKEGVQHAAGHYAKGCAVCHGAPGEARSAAVMAMLPQPPDLRGTIPEWRDAELFRIVKHGVRFTGMPAWPTQNRDDEVWAMVAFLRELPRLDAAGYRDLAYGEAPDSRPADPRFGAALADCARCHGADGAGRSAAVPVIAGQNEVYLRASLEAYAKNNRASGVMELAATQTDPALFSQLASHYAMQAAAPSDVVQADEALTARGREIAERGLPGKTVPACLNCHGRPDRNPLYPSLDGQKAIYLETQLRLFAEGKRGGTSFNHLMHQVAKNLEPADIASLSAYFAGRAKGPRVQP